MKLLLLLLFAFCAFFRADASLPPGFSETLETISKWFPRQTYSIITDAIREIIKNIEGVKDMNIQEFPIDPLNRLENIGIHFNVRETTFIVEETSRNINIKNLSIPLSLFLATGEYDFQGISFLGLDIYGKGDFRMRVEELRVFTALEMAYSAARGWKVKDFKAKTSMKECRIEIENLMDGEPAGEFLNFMANEIIKIAVDLLEGFVQEYNDEIKEELSNLINKLMGN